jgi:anti-sigma28 factor (negative regulator of flagellin synthesis)
MRVNDRNITGSSAAEAGRAQEIQKPGQLAAGRSRTSAEGSADRVEFSSSLGRLSQTLAVSGGERGARVEALAAQYRSGSYRVDPAAVSRGMVAEALMTGE